MPTDPIVLVKFLKVERDRQDELIALLKHDIETAVSTLEGWKSGRLIAAQDGSSVVIFSEWETPAAVEAMRDDPRMKACFPKILALASVDSILGAAVVRKSR